MVGTEEFFIIGSVLIFLSITVSIIFICQHNRAIVYASKLFRIKLNDMGVGMYIYAQYRHPLDN